MALAIVVVFVIGYLFIALEHQFKINKTATALFTGVVCWSIYAINAEQLVTNIPDAFRTEHQHAGELELARDYLVEGQLLKATGEISQILFFLMSAMLIVELVDAHEGFLVLTSRIKAKSKIKLLWIVAWLTFCLSAVLDNLTTTIIMISLLKKVIDDRETRLFYAGMIVIAANAGGAWTVIGDVTTTMLWIKGKIGEVAVMKQLLLPSLVCLLIPLLGISYFLRGELPTRAGQDTSPDSLIKPWQRALMLTIGFAGLLSVPIFKSYTHLPPFMGIVLALSVLWFVSEIINPTLDESIRSSTGVLSALKRIDMSSVLFFLGILLAVSALSSVGLLQAAAKSVDEAIPSREIVAIVIGLISAVVDNVPLVAAGIEMYDASLNDPFWMLLAYCAGTGGSCLIIGSAAGVAAMGLEQINFLWYVRRITPWALLGYFAGIVAYLATMKL